MAGVGLGFLRILWMPSAGQAAKSFTTRTRQGPGAAGASDSPGAGVSQKPEDASFQLHVGPQRDICLHAPCRQPASSLPSGQSRSWLQRLTAGTHVPSVQRNSSPRQVPSAAGRGQQGRVRWTWVRHPSQHALPTHIHPARSRASG